MNRNATLRYHALPAQPAGPVLTVGMVTRALVALTVVSGALVFTEPAPVDVLMMGLVVLLPLAGLQAVSTPLLVNAGLWFIAGAGALIATSMSTEVARSATHTGVSIFLYAGCFALSGFIAHRPEAHARLVYRAYTVAALVAAIAGLVGYFDLLPGAGSMFTKFGRAAGTFKDPNVYGPFLVPGILYCLDALLRSRALAAAAALLGTAVLSFALLLSFSRGAWFVLAVAIAIYLYFMFVTADDHRTRARIILIVALGGVLVAAGLAAALHVDAIAKLLSERSTLTQGYDVGPDGRFGGQLKAIGLILVNPLGIGATQFSELYHHEDVHNVYLSMFLNAGWLGGLAYIAAVLTTVLTGFAHLLRATRTRPLFLIAYAAFVGNVLEGAVIDTDHWRHFYLLAAIVWGLMAGEMQRRAEDRA